MPLYQCYTWDFRIEVPPYEPLLGVLDAFFSSYPPGDYTRELRETYKLEFRRGQWKRMLGVGPLVPAKLVPGKFVEWPIRVKVLARPSPEQYLVAVRYQLYLPSGVKTLEPQVQKSVADHAHIEMEELAKYLAQCIPLESPPPVTRA